MARLPQAVIVHPVLVTLLIVPVVMGCCIVAAVLRPAEVGFVSSSGDYKVEYVDAKLFFTFRDLAYLKITEQKHPERVFRSPLIAANSLEMNQLENSQYVGVDWVRFDKMKHRFEIVILGWHGSVMSAFISNTPYVVFSNE
ncbi:hypothetical protein [Pseudomonas baltica]|uniref:hypothetical protein n=1 Tax=Pseudomonas baltica TaxID=2762576 RepID=UPI00289EE983|nr:hypothetical protein [Pseudomonas baltica]